MCGLSRFGLSRKTFQLVGGQIRGFVSLPRQPSACPSWTCFLCILLVVNINIMHLKMTVARAWGLSFPARAHLSLSPSPSLSLFLSFPACAHTSLSLPLHLSLSFSLSQHAHTPLSLSLSISLSLSLFPSMRTHLSLSPSPSLSLFLSFPACAHLSLCVCSVQRTTERTFAFSKTQISY